MSLLSLVSNERLKLTANWLNAIATASVAAGVIAPVAAGFYGVGSTPVIQLTLLVGFVVCLFGGITPTSGNKVCSERPEVMSFVELLAFVIAPVTLAALGWGIAI